MLKYFILVFFSTAAFSFDQKIAELFVPSSLDPSLSCEKVRDQVEDIIADISLRKIEVFSEEIIKYEIFNKYFPLSLKNTGSFKKRSYPVFSEKKMETASGSFDFSLSNQFGVFACNFPSCSQHMSLSLIEDSNSNPKIKNLFDFSLEHKENSCVFEIKSKNKLKLNLNLPLIVLGEFKKLKIGILEANNSKFMQAVTVNLDLTFEIKLRYSIDKDTKGNKIINFAVQFFDLESGGHFADFKLIRNNIVIDNQSKITDVLNTSFGFAEGLADNIGFLLPDELQEKLNYDKKISSLLEDYLAFTSFQCSLDASNKLRCLREGQCFSYQESITLGNHISDLESIKIIFDTKTRKPLEVHASFHQWEDTFSWGEGLEFEGDHPKFYVAYGSHGYNKNSINRSYKKANFSFFEFSFMEDEFSNGTLWKPFEKDQFNFFTVNNEGLHKPEDWKVEPISNFIEKNLGRWGDDTKKCHPLDKGKDACLLVTAPGGLAERYNKNSFKVDDLELWKQIAKKYSPVYVFAKGEKFLPDRISTFHANSLDLNPRRRVSKVQVTDFLNPEIQPGLGWLKGKIDRSLVYTIIVPKEKTIEIDYWLYYPYNLGKHICLSKRHFNLLE
jgi:hypothetical protein